MMHGPGAIFKWKALKWLSAAWLHLNGCLDVYREGNRKRDVWLLNARSPSHCHKIARLDFKVLTIQPRANSSPFLWAGKKSQQLLPCLPKEYWSVEKWSSGTKQPTGLCLIHWCRCQRRRKKEFGLKKHLFKSGQSGVKWAFTVLV